MPPERIPSYRYELVDYRTNLVRMPGIEASRGCPFSCNFCVLTGHEQYRYRPVDHVIRDIRDRMIFNQRVPGLIKDTFAFVDNNLGGSPRYLRALCEAQLRVVTSSLEGQPRIAANHAAGLRDVTSIH